MKLFVSKNHGTLAKVEDKNNEVANFWGTVSNGKESNIHGGKLTHIHPSTLRYFANFIAHWFGAKENPTNIVCLILYFKVGY